MAIWQFHIYLIPQQSLRNKYGNIPTRLVVDKKGWNNYIQNDDLNTEPEFEDALTVHWWLDLNITFEEIVPFLKTFGDIQSWTENTDGLRCFGDSDTNDISVCFNDKTKIIEEISCRLDLRHFSMELIDKIFSLAIRFQCLLMDRQGRLFQPSIVALLDMIKLSNANRFVDDPERFLNDLSKGIVSAE